MNGGGRGFGIEEYSRKCGRKKETATLVYNLYYLP